MNSRWLVIGAVWTIGCASLPAKTPDQSLRVMSYNIEYGHEGLDSVAAVIRDERPDIVGLQEVDAIGQRGAISPIRQRCSRKRPE